MNSLLLFCCFSSLSLHTTPEVRPGQSLPSLVVKLCCKVCITVPILQIEKLRPSL